MTKNRKASLISASALALVLAACASSQPPPSVVSARSAYEQAARDPAVARNAALELDQSRTALNDAEQQWKDHKKKEDVDTAGYVAERRAQIAQETARMRDAQQRLQTAGTMGTAALAAAQNDRIQQLQTQLDQLRSGQPKGGMVLTLGSDVMFDTGKNELKSGAYNSVRQVAAFLKQHPDRTAIIRGFTDTTGSSDANMRLSQARADSVKAALRQEGVPSDQVAAYGMGESAPVATNGNAAGRQLNRRVEIALSNGNGEQGTTSSSSVQ